MIIEVKALSNGAHLNQSSNLNVLPDGWAVIPDDMEIPATFPFVHIEAVDGVVTSMTANQEAYDAVMGKVVEPEPTTDDLMNVLLGV